VLTGSILPPSTNKGEGRDGDRARSLLGCLRAASLGVEDEDPTPFVR
jgi:hypothetical protein